MMIFLLRDQLERDLIFLGLLIMENRLKPQSSAVIRQLKNANIRTVMVTGKYIEYFDLFSSYPMNSCYK